jgi:hypothetical protein
LLQKWLPFHKSSNSSSHNEGNPQTLHTNWKVAQIKSLVLVSTQGPRTSLFYPWISCRMKAGIWMASLCKLWRCDRFASPSARNSVRSNTQNSLHSTNQLYPYLWSWSEPVGFPKILSGDMQKPNYFHNILTSLPFFTFILTWR